MNLKHVVFLAGLLGFSGGRACNEARAEGSRDFGGGAHGLNRVIRTENNYTGVRAQVSIGFYMPRNEAGQYQVVNAQGQPVITNGTGTLDQDVMPFPLQGSKPSVYLGGTFPPVNAIGGGAQTEVDVGLQYEPVTLNNTAPGWSVFFYVDPVNIRDGINTVRHRIEVNLRVYDGNAPVPNLGVPWRSNTNPVVGTMTLDARASGSAAFTFSPVGTIYANFPRAWLTAGEQARWDVNATTHPVAPWADATQPGLVVFDPDGYANANVKRVTAMTRPNPFTNELDGSRIEAQWTNCQVRPHSAALRAWAAGDVNQNRTGYDAPETGNLAFDRRYNGRPSPEIIGPIVLPNGTAGQGPVLVPESLSRTIVQFSSDVATDNSMRSQVISQANNGRYANENVTLNMGMIARPVGQAVQ